MLTNVITKTYLYFLNCQKKKNLFLKLLKKHRAVVVERSSVLIYLMISSLELKVEGSNPASSVLFWAK